MLTNQIANHGRPLKSFGTASLNIQWPKESAVGKWLLYLTDIESEGLDQITCSPEKEVNPLRRLGVCSALVFITQSSLPATITFFHVSLI